MLITLVIGMAMMTIVITMVMTYNKNDINNNYENEDMGG